MEFLLSLNLMMMSNLNDKDDQNSSLRPTFILKKGQVESSSVISRIFSLGAPVLKLSEHNKKYEENSVVVLFLVKVCLRNCFSLHYRTVLSDNWSIETV